MTFEAASSRLISLSADSTPRATSRRVNQLLFTASFIRSSLFIMLIRVRDAYLDLIRSPIAYPLPFQRTLHTINPTRHSRQQLLLFLQTKSILFGRLLQRRVGPFQPRPLPSCSVYIRLIVSKAQARDRN